MAENSTLVSIRLPGDLSREVDELAKMTRRSRSFVVREAVTAYVEENRAYLQAVDEALTEADKGVFVSGDAVANWLNSWGASDELPAPVPDVFLPPKT